MGDLGVQVSVRSSIRQHLPWVSCERNSSYSFIPIFLKFCVCFRHGMRMCIWFGCYCEIIFCHLFHFVNLVIFSPQCIDSGYLVSATPHTILYRSFWNFCTCFLHGLKMCMWFGYNPCINFVTFLAHLSRRLTRWAYSIPMVRRQSVVVVRRRRHFQTWISLKPVSQSSSNFMCSITDVGERLHKVLGQIGSKLWFP